MAGVRATDQDRDKAVETIEDAYAKGQLNDAERELRTQKALQATTVDELQTLVSDLRPGMAIHSPSVISEITPTNIRKPLIMVAVIALVVLMTGGLVSAVKAAFDGISSPSVSNPFPPAKDSAKDGKLLTEKGLTDLITAVRKKFGSTLVSRAVIYPEYASFTLPIKGNLRHTQDWSFRTGFDKSIINGNRSEDDPLIDLDKVDISALIGWVKKSQTELNVKDVTTTYLVFDERDNGPGMSVYVSNEFSDLGYVSMKLDGTVTYLYKYK